ncbi:MAG: sigma-70 family RNA polymerase sigma factor [Oscillospiraceae bacterium]|nr:sigma-70 family RNA polymerase sigma factor [Oscillospiraceae bacterium]
MEREIENKLIQRVVNGDTNAFEDLVLANQKNVYNLALKMTRNEDDALDLSQEAFVKAYQQLSFFRGDSKFSVWLYRLTYNLCIDFLRKQSKQTTVSLDYKDDDNEVVSFEIPDLRDLPEDSAIRKEMRKTIEQSIEELTEDHREVLIMREITGMSYDEIAVTLKLSAGTVKSRIARARIKLIESLKEKGTYPENFRLT